MIAEPVSDNVPDGLDLDPRHWLQLQQSAISAEAALARPYQTIRHPSELDEFGFSKRQCNLAPAYSCQVAHWTHRSTRSDLTSHM
jgi:hypothetical protein